MSEMLDIVDAVMSVSAVIYLVPSTPDCLVPYGTYLTLASTP